MHHGDGRPARVLALCLGGMVVAFWGVTGLRREPPYRPPLFADSIATPASSADLPATPEGGTRIRIGFVGDLMQHYDQRHDAFNRSYALVAPRLSALDLAVGNLEFPVDSTLPVGPDFGTVRFNGSTAHLDAIAGAGFDVLQTANNHAHDRGTAGLLRTLEAVEGRGLRAVGTARSVDELRAKPVLVDVKDVRLGFRAYTIPTNTYLDAMGRPEWAPRDLPIDALDFDYWRHDDRAHGQRLFREHVAQARAGGANVVIALVHWGREYTLAPTSDQRQAARDLVDAGFDLVIGTHSHVLLPPEICDGRLIVYSLGNFLSRTLSLETSLGAVLEVELVKAGDRAAVGGFRYFATQVRLPGHVITPIDSAAAKDDAVAWAAARRVLGSALVAWD